MIVLNNRYRSSKNILIGAFILLILLPTLGLGYVFYDYSQRVIRQKVTDHTTDALEHSSLIIQEQAAKVETLINSIAKDHDTLELLTQADLSSTDYELKERFSRVDKTLKDLISIYGIDVRNVLITNDSGIYSLRERIYLDRAAMMDTEWYQSTIANYGRINWIGMQKHEGYLQSNRFEIGLAKGIVDERTFKKIGVIFLSLAPETFNQFLTGGANSETMAVMDAHNKVLFASSFNQTQSIPEQQGNLIMHSAPNRYGWVSIKTIPLKLLEGDIDRVRNFTIAITLVCLTLFAVCLFLIYRGVSKPLEQMVSLLNDIENDSRINLKKFPLYELIEINNSMVSLVAKNKSARDKTKEMEIGMLQAQINPHFLYNSLNSINQLAMMNNQETISRLIVSLIKFLKSSINKDGQFISLAQELENLNHYFYIQNFLYNGKINLALLTDPKLEQAIIPNFILQPILENSIMHGIHPNDDSNRITVRCLQQHDELWIEVEDNGVGMSQSAIDDIMRGLSNGGFSGLRSTHEKIRLIYGNEYGLTFASKAGDGTTITVRLPLDIRSDAS